MNHLPEVKRFFVNVVQKGDFPGVTVAYIPGRTPEGVLFDAEGTEVERTNVSGMSFDELVAFVKSKGFKAREEEQQQQHDEI